ncbi:hypothetical protein BBJ28_00010372 [Nothophytophthora sp. Chile5]|nr:hypothetical protein BBJ28_00010372 [Nothophytophthora sp. Chile5]
MADAHHEPGGGDGKVDGTNRERSLVQIIDVTQSELAQLWSAFGLSEEEKQQQQIVLSAVVEKACEARLSAWRSEMDRVTTRVDELEGEIRVIQRQFQRNEVHCLQYVDLVLVLVRFGVMEVKSAGWYVECLQQIRAISGGTLRDRLATLEMEFKFLESVRVRNNRVAEMRKLQAQLDRLDQKLGTDITFLREARLAEMLGQIRELWNQLEVHSTKSVPRSITVSLLTSPLTAFYMRVPLGIQVPEQERERFQQTYHGVGKAALASLARRRSRYTALNAQIAVVREAIVVHWDLLGYSLEAREYFSAMLHVPALQASRKVLRAHEKQLERLERQWSGMRILHNPTRKMARVKRKREVEGAAPAGRDARIADPYALKTSPCRFSDHHRKKSKAAAGVLRNCESNPNCLFGLGERQKGIWQSKQLIRRVFGDDPRERQRSVARDGVLLPCGLRNLGATCYLNSMLQCLFVNLPFRRAVYEWEPKQPPVNAQQALQMRALQKLFAQMQLGRQSFYDPTEFASTLALNNVLQQDAQFSKLLLAHLRTIFGQSRISSHWNLVDRIFQGQMSYVTKCLHCKNKSMRPSSYYEISLHIKGHKDVENCIGSYLSAEVLDGENKYFCEHCDSKQCAERFLELNPRALPPTLMVHLMRFVYDANAGRKKKLMVCISADVGHYTASVAYPRSTEDAAEASSGATVDWFEFDDAVVNDVAKTDAAKKSSSGKKIRSRDIYMLLYVRDDSASGIANAGSNADAAVVQPSEECTEEVEVLNAAFDADVQEYASKVNGMETRIQKRLDAYKRFFEKSQPYVDAKSTDFYWVDTEWLRRWVSGEEEEASTPTSSSASRTEDEPSGGKAAIEQHGDMEKEGEDVKPEPMDHSSDNEQTAGGDITPELEEETPTPVKTERGEENVKAGSAKQPGDREQTAVENLTSELHEGASVSVKIERGVDDGSVTESEGSPVDIDREGAAADAGSVHGDGADIEIIGESPPTPSSPAPSPPHLPSVSSSAVDGVVTTPSNIRDDEIPFSRPVDVTCWCCTHSIGIKAEASNNLDDDSGRPVLRFSPENVPKLKRVSVKLFAHLLESCSIEGPTSELTPRERCAEMKAFQASTYRCLVCEKVFRNKLRDDVERLKEVEVETALLKGSVANVTSAVAAGNAFLMSRAWINSYKAHLQLLQRELSQTAIGKQGKKARANQDLRVHFASPGGSGSSNGNTSTGSAERREDMAWQEQINEDITCLHGNLTLEKRKYRVVAVETWSYFSAKFPCRAEFPEATTDTCPQCQVDEIASKECIQVERASRDEILSDPALGALYRRKPSGDSIRLDNMFELAATQHDSWLDRASVWPKGDASKTAQRMFLVTRRWIAQWREYIRSVEQDTPPPLALGPLLCPHQRLVVPPSLLAAQQGNFVELSSLEVEFVSLEEILALAELYSDPEAWFYYGLVVPDSSRPGVGETRVVWRRCSLGTLQYGNEEAIRTGECPEGVIPLVCQDENGEGVTCAECQDSSQRRHRDEQVNFSNRIVNVQQLGEDQVVPTSESLTPDANTSGRRRSKRIRPDSASNWPVTANAIDTVYILKAKIYEEIGALPVRQRLYFKGEVLEDYHTLKQCGIKAGDAVFMRLSEDSADDLVMEDGQGREVGFADSVFVSHPAVTTSTQNRLDGGPPDVSGDHAMAVSMSTSQDARVWVCHACTYVNDDTDAECEMCSASKDGSG